MATRGVGVVSESVRTFAEVIYGLDYKCHFLFVHWSGDNEGNGWWVALLEQVW